jgi:hypothetical protein
MNRPSVPNFETVWRLARVKVKGDCRLRELKGKQDPSYAVASIPRSSFERCNPPSSLAPFFEKVANLGQQQLLL